MCIYCGTPKYRRIYESHFGLIPKDDNGRRYEIHHKDNDHSNNDPSNLACVPIQEHYNIHYAQEDWFSCLKIAERMSYSPGELSELSKKANQKRLDDGTHNFLKPDFQRNVQLQRMSEGTHPFTDSDFQRNVQHKRVANGTHPFVGGRIQSESNLERVRNGTHPSLIKKTCPHCSKVVGTPQYAFAHGDKCKFKT